MNRQIIAIATILLIGALGAFLILRVDTPAAADAHEHDAGGHAHEEGAEASEEFRRGPRGGRLLEADDLTLEVTIHEEGGPPEFRVYPQQHGKPLAPRDLKVQMELARLGGQVDRLVFVSRGDHLGADAVIEEPHSFDVHVAAQHAGHSHEWRYASHEGRTQIPAAAAQRARLEVAAAGPARIHETIELFGTLVAQPDRVRRVGARFPSVVRQVRVGLGERVRAGQTLAILESNESLQSYAVTSPIAGVVAERGANTGEVVDEETLFTVSDLSSVWAELAVFRRDLGRVRAGQTVRVERDDGVSAEARIAMLLPLSQPGSQAVTARVEIANSDGRWLPGTFVTGRVTTSEVEVPLAVRREALQTYRDFDVVYARVGDTYEVRMLELGRRDSEWVEVKGGLAPGTEYVTRGSYLVKADIEKSGAAHDH